MKKLTAIVLSIFILALSFKVGVARHYCGGILVKSIFSIGHEMASCGMEKEQNSCGNNTLFKRNCCSDNLQQMSSDDYNNELKKLNFYKGINAVSTKDYNVKAFHEVIKRVKQYYYPPELLTAVSLSAIRVFIL